MRISEHLEWLGLEVRDKVTKLEGVVTSVSFDLYGCVQVTVEPRWNDGKKPEHECRWYDVSRLIPIGNAVMEAPNFEMESAESLTQKGAKGPAEKPVP